MGNYVAVDAATGKHLWQTATLVAGGTLYADAKSAKGSEGVAAYSLTTGAKLWSYQATFEGMALTDVWLTGLAPDSSPLVVADLHGLGNPCPIEKLDPATGKPSQQYVLADNVDPDSALLTTAANGDYVLAPQNPQVGPGLTVMAAK